MLNKQSLKQHIEYKNHLLPYSINTVTVSNNQPDILFHFHFECEFIYVHSGSGRFHIENTIFNSQAGDIILIHPNALHSIHPIDGQSHHFTAFNFHLDLIGASIDDYSGIRYLKALQNGVTEFKVRLNTNDTHYDCIRNILFDIFSYAKDNIPYHSFLLKAKLNELFYHLHVNQYVMAKSTRLDAYRKEERIRQTIDYINTHYFESITITHLANVCGYSTSHFMSFFKQYVGISANDYLIKTRLKEATHLLEHTNDNIIHIATACGFSNLANFNRQFKKYYHCTPSQYRHTLVQ